jgi:hypothetical protein
MGSFVTDLMSTRSTCPTKTVLLIGTRHDYQRSGCQGSEPFRVQIESACRQHSITLLIEEMGLDALRLYRAHHSVCQEVADSLGIAHRYCDPSIQEQNQLGIANPGKSDPFSFSPVRDPHHIDPEAAAADVIRERRWFQHIIEADAWPVLFVCGAHHVGSFRVLLQTSGIVSDGLSSNWTPNQALHRTLDSAGERGRSALHEDRGDASVVAGANGECGH